MNDKIKTKKRINFTLPWPPSVNEMYTRDFHLTKKTRDYYKNCFWSLKEQFNCKLPKFYTKTSMCIEFFPRRNGGWDASNFRKATEDAIVKAGIIPDDQVKYLIPKTPIIHKRIDRDKQPYVKITMEEI